MSFILVCPNCGPRSAYEFRFGGEARSRPTPEADAAAWSEYLYPRRNVAGLQREWWFHRAGCRLWFQAVRDTVTNRVERTFWPSEAPASGVGG